MGTIRRGGRMFFALMCVVMATHFLASTASDAATAAQWTKRVPAQVDPGALRLYAGDAPGAEGAPNEEVWSDIGTERWARNVTVPTLLPVLPSPSTATGAAVILVPGGGFQFVSIDNEGYRIAEQLAARGIAAFILKYRVMATPPTEQGFASHIQAVFAGQAPYPGFDAQDGIPFAVADAQAALQLVHDRRDEWGVPITHIGMLGFSAGAVTSLGVALGDGAHQPDFLGYIYGPMVVPDIPKAPQPLFVALAADDTLFGRQPFGLVDRWRAAGAPVEFHFYERGGHGFASYTRGVGADAWLDQFISWVSHRAPTPTADPE